MVSRLAICALMVCLLVGCSGGSGNGENKSEETKTTSGCLADEALSGLADSDVFVTKDLCEAKRTSKDVCDDLEPPSFTDYTTRCLATDQLGVQCAATFVVDKAKTEPTAACYPIEDEDSLDTAGIDTDPDADWMFKCQIEGTGKCDKP